MAMKYEITAAQKEEIELARKANRDKRTEAKLSVLVMRAEGADAKTISEVTGFHSAYVSIIVSKYIHGGLEAITGKHYGGNLFNNKKRVRLLLKSFVALLAAIGLLNALIRD